MFYFNQQSCHRVGRGCSTADGSLLVSSSLIPRRLLPGCKTAVRLLKSAALLTVMPIAVRGRVCACALGSKVKALAFFCLDCIPRDRSLISKARSRTGQVLQRLPVIQCCAEQANNILSSTRSGPTHPKAFVWCGAISISVAFHVGVSIRTTC